MTPEGKIKARLKLMLSVFEDQDGLYQYWPVPSGYGPSTLDCLVCFYGVFIAIETKALGGKPTPRQEYCIGQITAAGGKAYVIDRVEKIASLRDDLFQIRDEYQERCKEFYDASNRKS
jgi:hypothetical protein